MLRLLPPGTILLSELLRRLQVPAVFVFLIFFFYFLELQNDFSFLWWPVLYNTTTGQKWPAQQSVSDLPTDGILASTSSLFIAGLFITPFSFWPGFI